MMLRRSIFISCLCAAVVLADNSATQATDESILAKSRSDRAFEKGGDGLAAAAQGLVAAAAGQHEQLVNLRDEMRAALDKEASKDLVEKRKMKEAELEMQKVLMEVERLRAEEEPKMLETALNRTLKADREAGRAEDLEHAKAKIDYE